MNKKINPLIGFAILFSVFSIALQIIGLQWQKTDTRPGMIISNNKDLPKAEVKRFQTEQEFKDYLARVGELDSYYGGRSLSFKSESAIDLNVSGGLGIADSSAPSSALSPELQRFSETNVQVAGIDEPDILKNNGLEIFYSPENNYYYRDVMPLSEPSAELKMMPPLPQVNGTKAIKAFPPASLALDSTIDKNGQMLLSGNMLVIFAYDKIYGYNVTDPKNPSEKWSIEYKNNSQLVNARLMNKKIYLITQTWINQGKPCPIEPLAFNNQPIIVRCVDIYYPDVNSQAEVTYNIMELNPDSGQVGKAVSFLGSYQSIVYMSADNLYLTYSYSGDLVRYQYNFFKENSDLVAPWVVEKLGKLMTYDISDQSKITEMMYILEKYYNSLDNDEQLRIENEMTNRLTNYGKLHGRELALTGIVKIALPGLTMAANGTVPGTPLNQFSLDEYQDNLRIATTIGDNWWGMGMMGGDIQSVNDVYVLNKDLNIIGKILDLGLEERIYSARFIEDKGYVVTFRQVDPFYVLDLSSPNNPRKVGELKIPGFSSYLHPITADKILGVGEENNQVKISLFDVNNPANPTELAKYNLDEYYTDVSNNHHAFLMDAKHNVFFLPGGKGGYIFSYTNNELKLVKAISDIQANRAAYINDYLYIVGDDKIVVLNETDWEKVNELSF